MRRRTVLASVTGSLLLAGCVGPARTSPSQTGSTANTVSLPLGLSDVQFSTRKSFPTHRYYVRTLGASDEDSFEQSSATAVELSAVEPPADDIIRTAISTPTPDGRSTLPNELTDTIPVGESRWIHCPDCDEYPYYEVAIRERNPDTPPLIEVTARVTNRSITNSSPATVQFTIKNRSDSQLEVNAGRVLPFGILKAYATDEPTEFFLWNDRYPRQTNVSKSMLKTTPVGTPTVAFPGAYDMLRLEQGETRTNTYEIHSWIAGLQPDRYRIAPLLGDRSFTYRNINSVKEETLSYDFRFTITD